MNSKRNKNQFPITNNSRYLKKQITTNSFNDKFTIYAEMQMGKSTKSSQIHSKQIKNKSNPAVNTNDCLKINKLKQTLRNLLIDEQSQNQEEMQNSNNDYIKNYNQFVQSQYTIDKNKHHFNKLREIAASSIKQSRYQDVQQEICEENRSYEQKNIEQYIQYNQKLQQLKQNLQIISEKQMKFLEPSLQKSGKSLVLHKKGNNEAYQNSYSYALKSKPKYKQATPSILKQSYNKSISIMQNHRKPNLNHTLLDDRNLGNYGYIVGTYKQRKSALQNHSFSVYSSKDKIYKNRSNSQTQTINVSAKNTDRVQQKILTDRFPQKILAPKIGVKQRKQKNKLNSVGKRYSQSNLQISSSKQKNKKIYQNKQRIHIDQSMNLKKSILSKQPIEYFGNKYRKKQKHTGNNLQITQRINTAHRAKIVKFISISSIQSNTKIIYTGSKDYQISRIQLPLDNISSQINISHPYRHRGPINDLLIGKKHQYLISCGQDCYLRLSVLREDIQNRKQKSYLYQSYKFDSSPVKIGALGEDIIGVATFKSLKLYDINKNKEYRNINYLNCDAKDSHFYISDQNSYFNLTFMSNQNNLYLGTSQTLYYLDIRLPIPYQPVLTSPKIVQKWMIDDNCHNNFAFICDIEKNSKQLNFATMSGEFLSKESISDLQVLDFRWKEDGKTIFTLLKNGKVLNWAMSLQKKNNSYSKKYNSSKISSQTIANIQHFNTISADSDNLYLGNKKGQIIIYS